MTESARELIRKRARNQCEYCRIHQESVPFLKHQIEHIVPRQHGGGADPENLALACYRCNKLKGPNLTAIDPTSGRIVRLFNPRRQRWTYHFDVRGALILGRTATGRATLELLGMNDRNRQSLRRELGQ